MAGTHYQAVNLLIQPHNDEPSLHPSGAGGFTSFSKGQVTGQRRISYSTLTRRTQAYVSLYTVLFHSVWDCDMIVN